MSEPTPAPATQSVVVQPSAPTPTPLSANVGALGEWAGAVLAIAAMLTLLYKVVTRELSRDVADVKHKLGNTTARVDALERLRTNDLERLVRLEVAIAAVKEGVKEGFDRIDRRLTDEFNQLSTSIREVRTVTPRGDRP